MIKKFLKSINQKGVIFTLEKVMNFLYYFFRKYYYQTLLYLRFSFYKTKYEITQNWFLNSELRIFSKDYISKSQKNCILEIGSYEGMSAIFFSNNYLLHPESTLTCVDPHRETPNIPKEVKGRFLRNIEKSKNFEKVNYLNMESDDFFHSNTKKFNFIYIDGNHEYRQVFRDLNNSSKVITDDGIIWLDDFLWYPENKKENPILEFLNENNEFIIIHKGYQIAIKKNT